MLVLTTADETNVETIINAQNWDDLRSEVTKINVSAPPPLPRAVATPNRHRRVLRKPVVYVFSPTEIDVQISLALSPEWSFSAVYPSVAPKVLPRVGEQIQWNVRTRADGTLTETNVGVDVAYLFWEAS